MTPHVRAKLIREHVDLLQRSFDPEEIAYLALTSKIEHAVRDRLAFSLHRTLKSTYPELIVAREWKRVDLAIIGRNDVPQILLELKAMYSYNMFSKTASEKYPGAVASDVDKMRRIAKANFGALTSLFALALITHPHQQPDDLPKSVTKYWRGMRAHHPPSLKQLRSATLGHFSEHQSCRYKELARGVAFGIPVTIYYCLFGPTG